MLELIKRGYSRAHKKLFGRTQPIAEIESRFWGNYPADKIIDGTIVLDLSAHIASPVAILGLSENDYLEAGWVSVWGHPDKDPVIFDDRPKFSLVGLIVPYVPKDKSAWTRRLEGQLKIRARQQKMLPSSP